MPVQVTAVDVPEWFAQRVAQVWGEPGQRWVDRLPGLVEHCARRWSLTVRPPYPLSYTYVAPVTRADGSPAVLKLGVPGTYELATGAEALRLAAGDGMAALLDADLEAGALLLERVEPGSPLAALAAEDDEAATAVLLDVMRRIHRPVPDRQGFPTVAAWGTAFGELRERHAGGTGPLPPELVDRAERTYTELVASSAPAVLLHGDLHHDNVLSSSRAGWLAVDPKGLLGEPAFDVGALLHNPWPDLLRWPDPARLLGRRVHQLAEGLGVDRERVRGWGFAFAVLSAVWFDEDGGPVDPHPLRCAKLLAALDD
jgi:streptomycin 6-kinase